MLKMLLTATRSCLKKTFAAAATFAVRCARGVVNIAKNAFCLLTEGWDWLGTKLRKPAISGRCAPTRTTMATKIGSAVKAVCLQKFFLFLGGFICVFLFPEESRGDLTWFERMLTSSRDFIANGFKAVAQRTTDKVASLFGRREAGDLIQRC